MLVGRREKILCSHTIVSGTLIIIGTKSKTLIMMITPNGDLSFDDNNKVIAVLRNVPKKAQAAQIKAASSIVKG